MLRNAFPSAKNCSKGDYALPEGGEKNDSAPRKILELFKKS